MTRSVPGRFVAGGSARSRTRSPRPAHVLIVSRGNGPCRRRRAGWLIAGCVPPIGPSIRPSNRPASRPGSGTESRDTMRWRFQPGACRVASWHRAHGRRGGTGSDVRGPGPVRRSRAGRFVSGHTSHTPSNASAWGRHPSRSVRYQEAVCMAGVVGGWARGVRRRHRASVGLPGPG